MGFRGASAQGPRISRGLGHLGALGIWVLSLEHLGASWLQISGGLGLGNLGPQTSLGLGHVRASDVLGNMWPRTYEAWESGGLEHLGPSDIWGPQTSSRLGHLGASDTWGPQAPGGLRHLGASNTWEPQTPWVLRHLGTSNI